MADHLPLRAQLDGPLPPASFGQVGRPSWRTRWRVYRKSAELDNALSWRQPARAPSALAG